MAKKVFKYELDQLVYYLRNNKIHSSRVLSRSAVENLHDGRDATPEQQEVFMHFGHNSVVYVTCHGTFDEVDIYPSKESLFAAALKGDQ